MLSKLTLCKPDELDEENRRRWIAAQQGVKLWNNPFLHPEFASLVARRRMDARLVIAEDHLAKRAYFAFHRGKGGLARPIGAPVSDYQAVITEPGFCVPVKDIMDEAGIGALPFTALADPLEQMASFSTHYENSHLLDLGSGPEAYFQSQQKQHHKYFKKMRQRTRAAIREYGSVELRTGDEAPQILEHLFRWKHDQYARTRKLDVLNVPWIRALLGDISKTSDPDFQSAVFGYRMGNKWAAAELGLLAGGVFHSWIAAYDPQFSRNSPGLLLLHEIINRSEELGIQQIDLGRGHEHYKKYYASSVQPLAAGCFLSTGPSASQRRRVFALCDGFAKLPLGKAAYFPGRLAGSLEYIASCHPQSGAQLKALCHSVLRKLIPFRA